MRHGKKVNHLGRTAPHRKALMANMASSLIIHKRITTTVAKAKALRTYVEPLITKGKDATTHNQRTVFAYLKDKDAVKELFNVVGGKVATRQGGYTRILKLGNRMGDNAEMAFIELVDFNEHFAGFGEDKKDAKKTRRGRSKAASEKTEVTKTAKTTAVTPVVEDAVVEETIISEAPAAENVETVIVEAAENTVVENNDESAETAAESEEAKPE